MSVFDRSTQLQSNDVAIARTELVVSTIDALEFHHRVHLVGADNTGKSSLLSQIYSATQEQIASPLVCNITLYRQGSISNCSRNVEKSLVRLRNRLNRELGGVHVPELNRENANSEIARAVAKLSKPLLFVVDDLYRFEGQWSRFPSASWIFDLIERLDDCKWIVCNNGASRRISESCERRAFETIPVPFFTQQECKSFFHQHFPELEKVGQGRTGISRRIHRITNGLPYLVMQAAHQLSNMSPKSVDNAERVLDAWQDTRDKTTQKIRDRYLVEKPHFDLIQRLVSDRKALVQDGRGNQAALDLVSTGAFKLERVDGESLLSYSNLFFERQMRSVLNARSLGSPSLAARRVPLKDLPVTLANLRRRGTNLGILVDSTVEHLKTAPETELFQLFLKCTHALFRLQRCSMFMAGDQPPRRLSLIDAVGKDASTLKLRRDDLGWAAGLGVNDWLREASQSETPLVISSVSAQSSPDIGSAWTECCSSSNSLVAVPLRLDGAEESGVLVFESSWEYPDSQELILMLKLCSDMASRLIIAYERLLLRNDRKLLGRQSEIISTALMAKGEKVQARQICERLRRALAAAHVDIATRQRDGSYKLEAFSNAPEVREAFFPCEFRDRVVFSKSKDPLIENKRGQEQQLPILLPPATSTWVGRKLPNGSSVLTLGFEQKRLLSDEELGFISSVADLAAVSLANLHGNQQKSELVMSAIRAFVGVTFKTGFSEVVRLVSDYLGISQVSVSVEEGGKIRVLASQGYREGYDDTVWGPDEGRTGLVITRKKVVRQKVNADCSVAWTEEYIPGSRFRNIDRVADEFLEKSQGAKYWQGDQDYFYGIPVSTVEDDNTSRVVGCLKIMHAADEDPVTEDQILDCLEMVDAIAPTIRFANERLERQRIEEERIQNEQRSIDLAQRLESYKIFSHDINVPITTMTAAVRNIRKNIGTVSSPDGRESLENVLFDIDRELQNLRRLSTFSKEVRSINVQAEAISIKSYIEGFSEARNDLYEALEISSSVETRGLIFFDRHHLDRILENLVANAYEAGASSVDIRVREDQDGIIEFCIEDNGRGFETNDIALVWSSYYTTKEAPDSGNGLAIVRALVEANRGTCDIPSQRNGKTVVCFSKKELSQR